MKKIININLSGRVIPIEDSAYEMLQAYIESLRRYFANEEGRDEIINDIESRIAELMSEKVRLGSASITDNDVNDIIASMGRPEDFEAAENEKSAGAQAASAKTEPEGEYTYTASKPKSRLYRDSSDKMIGGVCSGLANYLNIDTSIVRLLFAIITFGGFGAGILIYILLWIVLPVKGLEEFEGKRLYRNSEDRILGGVGSGLAAYFGRDPWFIRILFAAPLLLNIFFRILNWPFHSDGSFVPNIVFGSISGTFILAYIVLWIVLPEAKSQYQKMEMRGEKVDVNTIRQNVKEGIQNTKSKIKDWGTEVKSTAQQFKGKAKEFADTRGKSFASEASSAVRRTGSGIGRIIGILFKIFFLFIAGTIAFALFVALMGLVFGGIGMWPLTTFILDGFWQNAFAWGTLILFLGVPLIGFIIWLLRRIMRVKSQSNYLGWTFGGLWTLGWVSVACLGASLSNDFRVSNDRTDGTEMSITQPAKGKLLVSVSEPEVEYSGSLPWISFEGNGMDITRDSFKLSNVRIRVEQSKDSSFHVEVKKYSRGRTLADAEEKAQRIVYNVNYKDSVLDVGSGIAIGKETKFRGQQAIVVVKIPSGRKIRFDESLNKLHELNIRMKDNRNWNRRNRRFDIDMDHYFDYKTGVDYTMGADGELKGPDGVSVNSYRYSENDSTAKKDSVSEIQRQIDEEIRRKDESEKKIRDLENKKKQSKPSTKIEVRMEDKNNEELAGSPSAVFSLISWLN